MLPTTSALLAATALSFAPHPSLPAAPNPSSATDDDAPETVVTASRAERPLVETPQSFWTIDRDEIERRSYRTVPQALRNTPGVLVQETSHGQGSPFIRGFTAFRTLLLIDGVRLNNSGFREGPNQYWATVDAFSIDRFELLRGPGSALYGSDAIGGTLQVFTRDPWAEDGTASARLTYRVHSSENSHIGRIEASAVEGPLGIVLGATAKELGDVHGGSDIGDQPNTAYDEWDVDGKIERWFDGDTRLVLGFQKVNQDDVPRTHSTSFAKSFEGSSVGSDRQRDFDQERDLLYLQLHGSLENSIADDYSVGLSWQRQKEEQDRIRSSGSRSIAGYDVDTFGGFARFEKELSFGTLTYGVDHYHDEIESYSSTNPIQGQVADDSSYDLIGAYAQHEFAATDTVDVTLGVRAEYAEADAGALEDPENAGTAISFQDNWTSVVGSARFVWDLSDDEAWKLFGGLSQGFRAPNLSDLTRLDTIGGGSLEVPSLDLDPEQFLTFELGTRVDDGTTSGEFAVFYTDIDDLIQRSANGDVINTEDVLIKSNSGDGYVWGIEFGAEHRIDDAFTLFGTAAYQDGELDTLQDKAALGDPDVFVTEPVSRLMPFTARVGLRWEDPGSSLWAEFIAAGAAKQDELSQRDIGDSQRIPPGGTPSYLVLHARAGLNLGERTEVTLGLENLTDEDYRFHGSGSNQPGFGVLLAVSHTF